jgi:plastocyanin
MASLAAVAVISVAFVACRDGDDAGDEGGGDLVAPATVPAAGNAGSPAPGGGGESIEVMIEAAAFSLSADRTSVPAGASVRVAARNTGEAPHTVTFYTSEDYSILLAGSDSGQLLAGESATFTATAPQRGEMFYRCEIHPSQMQGEIAVE